MSDNFITINELKMLIHAHLKARGWHKPSSRNIAVSISIEAAELLEHYQWDDDNGQDKRGVSEELVDIIAYCLTFANINDIDISSTLKAKIKKLEKKYPTKLFNKERVGYDDYKKIKKAHRTKK